MTPLTFISSQLKKLYLQHATHFDGAGHKWDVPKSQKVPHMTVCHLLFPSHWRWAKELTKDYQ